MLSAWGKESLRTRSPLPVPAWPVEMLVPQERTVVSLQALPAGKPVLPVQTGEWHPAMRVVTIAQPGRTVGSLPAGHVGFSVQKGEIVEASPLALEQLPATL